MSAAHPQPSQQNSEGAFVNTRQINSRFGMLKIDLDKVIYFHHGLLGFSSNLYFCLTELPNENHSFKLLQSIQDENLTFIVHPLLKNQDGKLPHLDPAEVKLVQEELEILDDDLVMLLIAQFQEEAGKPKVLVNLRAPIIIDVSKNAGIQYVFLHNQYPIKFELPLK